jgi:hypothetical protein
VSLRRISGRGNVPSTRSRTSLALSFGAAATDIMRPCQQFLEEDSFVRYWEMYASNVLGAVPPSGSFVCKVKCFNQSTAEESTSAEPPRLVHCAFQFQVNLDQFELPVRVAAVVALSPFADAAFARADSSFG